MVDSQDDEAKAHRRGRHARLTAPSLVAAHLWMLAPAAVAAPGTTDVPPAPLEGTTQGHAEDTTVHLQSPEPSAWPEAMEAIAFELDQAGYHARFDASAPASASIIIRRQGEHWRLQCTDARGQVHEERGSTASGPDLVALLAVEMLVAAQADPRASVPPQIPTEATPPTATPMLTEAVPIVHDRRATERTGWERWALEVGAGMNNLSALTLAIGAYHRWSYIELGLALEGGATAQRDEFADGSNASSVTASALAAGRLATAVAFRPERRVRPTLGLTSAFVVPFVRSTYRGVDPLDPEAGFVNATVTSAGLMWVPAATTALRVGLRPRLALQVGAHVGPALTLRVPELASGDRFGLAGWMAGATVGFVVGSTGDWR